jgi:hypothetical protein
MRRPRRKLGPTAILWLVAAGVGIAYLAGLIGANT